MNIQQELDKRENANKKQEDELADVIKQLQDLGYSKMDPKSIMESLGLDEKQFKVARLLLNHGMLSGYLSGNSVGQEFIMRTVIRLMDEAL